jgi:cellobiose-specific phosphotransferase system component IIC
MTSPHPLSISALRKRRRWLLPIVLFGCLFLAHAHAQSSSAVFSGPQNMDQGLQSGMNNITGYVFAILKFLSIIGLGIAYYFVTHNGLGKAILATVASILLWFAPVVANIAQSIGSSAAQQSQVTTSSS